MSKVEKAATVEVAPPRKRRKIVMLALAAALFLGSGATSGWLLLDRGAPEEKPVQPGDVVPLDSVTVNLSGGHYLKMKIALQTTADMAEKPDGSRALDLAISHYSNRQLAELSSAEGRLKAKNDLLQTVNTAYENQIMDIYFTEFVMQ